MRVIAGTARSINLITPKGFDTRPTTDKYKETLFNCLQSYVGNSVFVDLFSGSGAIGIEALSRGAAKAYFCDNSKEAIDCIKANLSKTKLADRAVVYKEDCSFFVKNRIKEIPDIIFIDPPFKKHLEKEIIPLLDEKSLIGEDTIIVVECDYESDFDFLENLSLEIFKIKEYKTNKHVFIRKIES
ncbi:MAG: 16S rRNA (guanine(966)-N(2))-methyltransferase RsmD [Lachnospiraceae bacterium]|nr:16S rRNA (guanine(966)-N(2))-methyltransferase RsmD [Lachnospiraceae bacterium]